MKHLPFSSASRTARRARLRAGGGHTRPGEPMRDRDVLDRAKSIGLQSAWTDAFGRKRRVTPEILRALLNALCGPEDSDPRALQGFIAPLYVVDAATPLLNLPARVCRNARRACVELEFGGRRECAVTPAGNGVRLTTRLPPGYHDVEIGGARTTVAAAPSRCFTIGDALQAARPRAWGIAAQVYSLQRRGDLGFGDFTALAQLARAAARAGAAALAISPVHALRGAEAGAYRPYSPSHRCFLNPLHADPGNAATHDRRTAAELASLRRSSLIDWPRSAAIHRELCERQYRCFVGGSTGDAGAYAEFRASGGAALAHHACFDALDENLREHGHAGRWPAPLRDAEASGAHAFSHARADRVGFHTFLQWRAACGLAATQAAARESGMAIGLIADLAVGVDPCGSECWSRPRDMLQGVAIGAPPDPLNALGQNWGLTTFSPFRLTCNGYQPFLDLLRASMRYAGGVRIDHVMGLMRLWLVPAGANATAGAYLEYPFADLLRLLALESWRRRCIVIGEDLGTVPAQCRRRLAAAGVHGLDVLPFMRDGGSFLAPRRWRGEAVATTSTHDLPPLAGWWQSRDLDWRSGLQLFGEIGEADERRERKRSRIRLASMLSKSASGRVSPKSAPARIVDAAISAVGSAPAPLAVVPIEDLLGTDEQPNLPGTVDSHPNWRRRYHVDAAALLSRGPAPARLRRLIRARGERR